VNVNDYLIEQARWDWQIMFAGWAEILPDTFTIWLVNRFAEVFFIAEDGSIHFLDITGGTLDRVADSREDFAVLMDVPDNANNWLMVPVVDECGHSGEAERWFRREAERHSGMIPNTIERSDASNSIAGRSAD
jgi:hypothetical protein